MRHWVQAQLRSSWIETFAIPVIASIMDAQLIFVVLVFVSPVFAGGQIGDPFLSEITIILLGLVLRWWAMWLTNRVQHGMNEQRQRLLRVLGLLLAAGLVVGTPLLQVRTVLSLIFSSALVLWFWWRSMRHADGLSDEQLVTSFRIGFAILLVVLLLSVFYLDATYNVLFTTLAQALPIFFLSGLLGLSFTRIALIRRESTRYAPDRPASGSTRNWLIALTVFWIAVVGAVLAFSLFSFQAILEVVIVLWAGITAILNVLLTIIAYIITPILYVIAFLFLALLNLFHMKGGTAAAPVYPAQRSNPIGHPEAFSPEALTTGRFVLLSLSLIILFFVARAILRRVRTGHKKEGNVEEIREGISLRALVQQRRDERIQRVARPTPPLEALDSQTARAHYRDLLQTMAINRPELARRADETPTEYQIRLLTFAQEEVAHDTLDSINAMEPSNQTVLDTLTHNYSLERYGGKDLEQVQQSYLRKWVPRLIARLTGKA